ncbi:glycoside hydrolase family 105 protein [Saccharata proteae CBS 121410]|uniref:Glycoside hydrolase family 105 protein n=1 Tax=Saccharata proteae CBS 121410 TaxID=1314787 RepID=A0A9P4HVB9_9PEZI|nr:glycoside hydrolase family 105 protein [Saccharata proteae CBS 121410]
MADSQIAHGVEAARTYQDAVFYRGVEMVYNVTSNPAYLNFLTSQLDTIVSPNGSIADYPSDLDSLDDIRFGTILLDMYALTNKTSYKLAASLLRQQLNTHPRTDEGQFWHRSPTYPDQGWLDGIYMANVFYAQWTAMLDSSNTTAWNDILLQYVLIDKHCRNHTTQLLVHGYDESKTELWADPVTGASPHVWDRALGWYFMALVDALDWFPSAHPGFRTLLGFFRDLAWGVTKAMDAQGAWWLVMDEPWPGKPGNYFESSGGAMFCYGLLKGVRKGYIGEEYLGPAKMGYGYMLDHFVAHNGTNGTLNWEGTVVVGSLGSNATFEYYVSEPVDENDLKGAGPFIYTAVEFEALKG